MKKICLSVLTIFLSGTVLLAQTSATQKPATTTTKPASTKTATTTKPTSTTTTKTATTNKPAATAQTTSAPASGAASDNKMQQMYDEYHGVNQSKTGAAATMPTNSKSKSGSGSKPAAATKPVAEPTAVASTKSTGDDAGFHIGVRGGANYLLPLETVAGATYGTEIGYHGGLVLNFGRGVFSFQPEINYSQQKIKASTSSSGSLPALSVTAIDNRIEVPLLLKFSFGNPSATRFFVNVGPYGTYTLSGQIKGTILGIPYNEKVTFDGTEGRISYGAAGGLGVALKLGPGHLTVEGRGLYHIGDNSPKSTGTTSPTEDPSGINRVLLQGSIGYLIPIGGR